MKSVILGILAIVVLCAFAAPRYAKATVPAVYSANSNGSAYALTCLYNQDGTYTFTSIPAGDVAIEVKVPIKPTASGSNGSIWLTDGSGTDITVAHSGMHSSQDADYALNKMAFRTLYGKVVGFAGGTLTIKLTGSVESCGQTFEINNDNALSDPRWFTNVLVTVN